MKNANARKTLQFDIQTVQSFRESQEEFDTLAMLASRGDRRAIGAIAAAMGSDLLNVARAALKGCEDEAGDVVQDFMVSLLEERWPFNREQGGGLTWMFGIVKMIARNRRRETLRGWRIDGGGEGAPASGWHSGTGARRDADRVSHRCPRPSGREAQTIASVAVSFATRVPSANTSDSTTEILRPGRRTLATQRSSLPRAGRSRWIEYWLVSTPWFSGASVVAAPPAVWSPIAAVRPA